MTAWPAPAGPSAECVNDWSQGIPLDYTRDLAGYWAERYDWRAREALLNRFDQFIAEIDGLAIHFIHQRSAAPDAFPLIITHGWPGSIVEFHKVIEPLTDPRRTADGPGRVPRRVPVASGLRFLRQADAHRAGASARSPKRGKR